MAPSSTTPTVLQQALADLPTKPRVHELAKRSGTSSKELIAALAARGVVAKSAQSSVELDVAVALLTSLLDEQNAAAPISGPIPAPEQQQPAALPLSIPLFMEPDPEQAKPTRKRTRSKPAPDEVDTVIDVQADAAETADGPLDGEVAAPTQPRRSRSRSATKPLPIDATPATDLSEVATTGPDQPADVDKDGEAPSPRTRSRRSRSRKPATDAAVDELPDNLDAVAIDPDEPADRADDEAASDTDSGSDSGRRRRRRGRRGRGRAEDGTDQDQSDAESSADDDAAPAAENDSDEDGDPSVDADSEAGAGSRRRRRRRRRGGGEDGPRDDDPDNTVVHVRETRSADTRSSDNEVQGIKGSTRLEAKRQRRRDSRDSRRRPQILTEAEFLARRESVERVMAVRQRGDLAQVALLEDDIMVEHFVSKAGSASMIGDVFLGKVQNVLPSMEAAFVDIGRGRNAVLYAGEVDWDATGLSGKARRIETALSPGDAVLVQVSKDPVGHKGARLTTQISLPGRFLVYVPGGGATGISRKLPDTERKRLKKILDRIVPEDAGVIIRTAAEGVAEDELVADVARLQAQWADISAANTADGKNKPFAPQQLSAEPDTLIKVIRDLFNSDISSLIIDGADAYASVLGYVEQVAPELAERVNEYTGSGDVFSAYRIDEQIAKALERKVHLPSGGSLVIDRTEAMTVVDVNTGKYTGSGGNLEETVTKNNLEAAEEIVRQLRLRDIGGIIVVDFIDMVLESNRDLVLRRLTECLGRDRTRHQVAEVTSLGLVQMTRKRLGTGLVETFSENCEHCHGRGIVLKDVPVDQGGDDGDKPAGRKRRERRKAEPAAEPIRIATVKADPRGPRPPLRPGAPVRGHGDPLLEQDNEDIGTGIEKAEVILDSDPIPAESNKIIDAAPESVESLAVIIDGAAAPVEVTVDDGTVEVKQLVKPAARPRRRRAASRPAGPASPVG